MSDIGNAAVLNKKKLKDGMIKSRKTRAGDLVIAGICFILMLVCILPMLHVLASSLSSADALDSDPDCDLHTPVDHTDDHVRVPADLYEPAGR